MIRNKKILLALLAILVLVGGTALTMPPTDASGCAHYHTVWRGEFLTWIGRHYGVNWLFIAQVNGIRGPRYVIYPGQVLCIPSRDYYGYNYPSYYPSNYPSNYPYNYPSYSPAYYPSGYQYAPARTWSFSILNVVQDTSVTVQMENIPASMKFKIKIGRNAGGSYTWIDLPDMDTGTGGSFQAIIPLPTEFAGTAQLILRMEQIDSSGYTYSQDQWFNNKTGDKGIVSYDYTPGYYNNYYYPYYGSGYWSGYGPGYWSGYPYYPKPWHKPGPGSTVPEPVLTPVPWPGTGP